jgi:hypothetical protein
MTQECLLFVDASQVEEIDFSIPVNMTDPELDEDYYGKIVVALIEQGFLPDRRQKGWLPFVERRKHAPGSKVDL